MEFYVIKDGECLTSFDNELEANEYAKRMGGIVKCPPQCKS